MLDFTDKTGLIHRKLPVLTTTTILIYPLLTVNLFALFMQKAKDVPASASSGLQDDFQKKVRGLTMLTSINGILQTGILGGKLAELWISICISTGTDCVQTVLCTQGGNLSRISDSDVQSR